MADRDLAWEALVRETHANPAMERGKLNSALKGIREAALTEGLTEEGLPEEIRLRAQAYRDRWPQLTLTPNALAVHWFRVIAPVVEARSAQQIAIDNLRARHA
jgi:hypothetical protein